MICGCARPRQPFDSLTTSPHPTKQYKPSSQSRLLPRGLTGTEHLCLRIRLVHCMTCVPSSNPPLRCSGRGGGAVCALCRPLGPARRGRSWQSVGHYNPPPLPSPPPRVEAEECATRNRVWQPSLILPGVGRGCSAGLTFAAPINPHPSPNEATLHIPKHTCPPLRRSAGVEKAGSKVWLTTSQLGLADTACFAVDCNALLMRLTLVIPLDCPPATSSCCTDANPVLAIH